MAKFVKGDIVVVPFPFSDLTQSKRRPALILAELSGDDFILSQITSHNIKDRYSISIETKDFESGSLNRNSNIRPNRIFTADKKILLYKAGHLKRDKIEETIARLIKILSK
jgi:mRNA interferase MazF